MPTVERFEDAKQIPFLKKKRRRPDFHSARITISGHLFEPGNPFGNGIFTHGLAIERHVEYLIISYLEKSH